MSDKRKSNWWDRIAPFTHDQCQARYETLLQEALKLEAALERISGGGHKYTCTSYIEDLRYHQNKIIEDALGEFKKWKERKR